MGTTMATIMTTTTTTRGTRGPMAPESLGASRSPARRMAGAFAILAALALVLWATAIRRPGPSAAPTPVSGRKLSEFGQAPVPPPPPPAAPTGSPAEPAIAAPARLDFTTPLEMEKRTIKSIPVVMDGAYRKVTFAQMGSWEYKAPAIPKEGEIPADFGTVDRFPEPIRALNGEKISIEGFMIPVEVEKDKVKSFVFVSSPLVCCFGLVPKLNEWFLVKMAGDARAYIMMDLPVTVRGRLSMGEEVRNRSIVSLFRIEADEVIGPRDF